MKVAKPKVVTGTATSPRGFFFVGLFALVLAVLFWKSFVPGYVHFSNDGPLGQQVAAWAKLPGGFTGAWGDLNDIGNNGGSFVPDFSALFRWLVGPVAFAKFFPPFALFILGLGAWTFFRQLKFSPLAATLGGLAAALNSAFFSSACWGVATQQIGIGMDFFALALVVSNSPETPALLRWVRLVLAGLCVGVNVMEASDIGAIFSLFVAAFVLFKTLTDESGPVVVRAARGVIRVAVIAVFAGFIAYQAIVSLLGTSVTGIAGTAQDEETKVKQWRWATQWSEPKIETLSLFVPGLFGYKLDTPNNMDEFQGAYIGGNYWGAVGRDPVLDQYFANGAKGTPPPYSFMRQTGGGDYVGILVALLAAWAVGQSFRRQNSAFTPDQRKMIWFWFAVLVFTLPMSFGRFGFLDGYPYRLFYDLPYGSVIRNPTKFLLVFSWAIVILFGYGVQGLSRRYLQVSTPNIKSSISQLQSWWRNARGFDRNWTIGCGITFAVCVLAWLVYASQKSALVNYLKSVYVQGDAEKVAAFSIGQAGWFLLFFALAIGIVLLIIAGVFAGRRAKLGGVLLGLLLLADMGRANLPWINHWNYPQKYASDPIIDFLKTKPYEHRVIQIPLRVPDQYALFNGNSGLYAIEWVQQLFPYYNIQSLDLVMRPRVGSDLETYENNFLPSSNDDAYLMARRWELTNTRYILGPAAYLNVLNQLFDPTQHRFRIARRFTIVPKPGVAEATSLEELSAAPDTNGPYALFEFTGALPRAKLYANWQWPEHDKKAVAGLTPGNLGTNDWALLQQVGTNDFLTLKDLASPSFDPWQTVLLADSSKAPACDNPTNANPGTVEFTSYATTHIKLHTQATEPTVLLLNDKYDPQWTVTVDGKSEPLLRANFIMRGVYLPAGGHDVQFDFSVPRKPLYVTLSAMGVGLALCCSLIVLTRQRRTK
ncbi:MAG TPA: hypothetical protein VFY06_06080 [Verrucomicrobiae bacterium]|nr:hypothetical protein [Verrucomicrobiae bacterium]